MKKTMVIIALGLFIHSGVTLAGDRLPQAHVGIEVDKALLEAMKHDTATSTQDKLRTYRCQNIKKYLGFPKTATGQATKYSCNNNAVGVLLNAGPGLGKHSPEKVGGFIVDKLRKEGLQAELFITPDYLHGASVAFYVNGDSQRYSYLRPSEAIKKIEGIAANAKMILLVDRGHDSWPNAKKRD